MKEIREVTERDTPCPCCNCCMRVEDGEYVHNIGQEEYCIAKFSANPTKETKS